MQTINPHALDVVQRDGDYVIYMGKHPLTTPMGNEVSDLNNRLLEHVLRELSFTGSLDPSRIDGFTLLSLQKDFLEKGVDPIGDSLGAILRLDPLVQRKLGQPQAKNGDVDSMIHFLEEHNQTLTLMFGGIAEVLCSFNEFLTEHIRTSPEIACQSYEEILPSLTKFYRNLPLEKLAVIILLSITHESGVMLPLLLALGKITASEYVNTLFVVHFPYLDQQKSSQAYADLIPQDIQRTRHLPDWQKPKDCFASLHIQALRALEYLSYYKTAGTQSPEIADVIRMGENLTVEFKTSLRWNILANRKDSSIEHASLKTIDAFLNSGGGTLFIGVKDDGIVEGIEIDGFPNRDRFSLHFWNLVKASMGEDVGSFIRTSFEEIQSRTVFIVRCAKSPGPVFLKQKGFGEEFYIRIGPSSAKLGIQEALKYIDHRFERP